MTDIKILRAKGQRNLALGLFAIAAMVQGTILFNVSGFTLTNYGWSVSIIYLAAAVSIIILPWVAEHLDEIVHIKAVRMGLMAFCAWLTFEEHLHAAEHYTAPEGVEKLASLWVSHDIAVLISKGLLVIAIFIVVEVFSHINEVAQKLYAQSHRELGITAS